MRSAANIRSSSNLVRRSRRGLDLRVCGRRARLAALAVAALAAAAMRRLLDRGTLAPRGAVPATLGGDAARAAHAMAVGSSAVAQSSSRGAAEACVRVVRAKVRDEWGLWTVDAGSARRNGAASASASRRGGDAEAAARWRCRRRRGGSSPHGLIMEARDFPMPSGRAGHVGGRETTAVLTVDAASGRSTAASCTTSRIFFRQGGALPRRSAARRGRAPPVTPGAAMPPVAGTEAGLRGALHRRGGA